MIQVEVCATTYILHTMHVSKLRMGFATCNYTIIIFTCVINMVHDNIGLSTIQSVEWNGGIEYWNK